MMWVFLFCLVSLIVLMSLHVLVYKTIEREQTDGKLHRRMNWIRKHIGPKVDFAENLFWWVATFYVIYLIWG